MIISKSNKRKKIIIFFMTLFAMFILTSCTLVQPYTETEVQQYAMEYYGENITYNDCIKVKNDFYQEKCKDYHFTSEQGFDFTVTSGVTRARKWIFLVIHIPFLKSDYTEQMINYYKSGLDKIINSSELDARWQETDAGTSFRYIISDESQIKMAAKIIIDMKNVLAEALPVASDELPISLVEEIPIYGYTPVEQDEVGVYWGTIESVSDEDVLIQDMTAQYKENYTDMHYGEVPEE